MVSLLDEWVFSTLGRLRRGRYPVIAGGPAQVVGRIVCVVSTPGSSERLGDRVERAAKGRHDDRVLRRAMLEAMRTSVDFDAFAWLLTDPVTTVGSSPMADVPCLPELPRLIRLKYLTPVARWTLPDRPPVLSLLSSTNGRPADSLVWRELMADYDVVDVASLVFADRFGCWGFLDLWRQTPAPPFSARELDELRGVVAPVTAALRRSQADTLLQTSESNDERPGPVVMVLSPDLDVRAQTPETERVLRMLVPPSGEASPVPAAAYNVGAQLLAVEAGVDSHPPTTRVHVRDEWWVTLRAARIVDADGSEAPDIAVTIEQVAPAERVELFVRAVGLSAREGELVQLLRTGSSTREAAALMLLSPHTVGDHLKSIFAKTGCRSRGELLARAVGR
jgi:DNA-binding CsgD family transcriptional regulator